MAARHVCRLRLLTGAALCARHSHSWVVNPKVEIDSQSTPITRSRGLLKALLSATRALLLTN